MIERRPRSSAPAWNAYPTNNARVPISHVVWPANRTSDIGWATEIVGRCSAPFCWSVAATAKRKAATSARPAAMPRP